MGKIINIGTNLKENIKIKKKKTFTFIIFGSMTHFFIILMTLLHTKFFSIHFSHT